MRLALGLQYYKIDSEMIAEIAGQCVADKKYLKVFPYTESDAALWDRFIVEIPMANFLHSRRYLSYHAERFQDISLLIKDEKNRLVGLFLAAVDQVNRNCVASHPGITYGGMLHAGSLYGEKMLEAFEVTKRYYATQGFERLRYKAVPYIYHQSPASDDIYALFRLGAVRYRCDLSCVIDLTNRPQTSQRRKRGLKKALKQGVEVKEGANFAKHFWLVLEENLARKHGTRPVHSVEEILYLHSLFPQNIKFTVGLLDSQVIAGVVLFVSPLVVHAQYIASSMVGYKVDALDAVFEHCIEKARAEKARYFSFGISTESEGQYLNQGLYQFKTEFGGGGVVHDFYEVQLKA
ncbi:GNAT family N-acetyltransferase [Chlorogloeopsis sp. ULAP02]|uniref:GNAT family N-acetyltransferase n=1 Tax=Chlorogloeopsis sp. ULAP02 TaxID=3107926 RepID=UPI00313473EA